MLTKEAKGTYICGGAKSVCCSPCSLRHLNVTNSSKIVPNPHPDPLRPKLTPTLAGHTPPTMNGDNTRNDLCELSDSTDDWLLRLACHLVAYNVMPKLVLLPFSGSRIFLFRGWNKYE